MFRDWSILELVEVKSDVMKWGEVMLVGLYKWFMMNTMDCSRGLAMQWLSKLLVQRGLFCSNSTEYLVPLPH